MVGTAQDVTEREATLRLTESRLQAIINAEPACVKLVSLDGRLLDMNPAGLAMIDATDLSQVVGRSIIELVHPDDRTRFLAIHHAAYAAQPARGEFRISGFGGGERWVESHSVPFETSEGERAVLSVTSDITERKRLEEQLRQSQKMEAVGRLAGGIAHDFNNLLTAIRGNAELMSNRVKNDPNMAAEVDEILHAADRAASLTRQLLAFSRKQVLQPVALDLNEIVSSVSRMARRLIGTDVQLRLDLAPSVSQVLADPAQVEQVLLNLIVNARDAMPSGGNITVQTKNVRLESNSSEIIQAGIAAGAFVMLAVTDDGIGMDKATQARIFEPFFTTKETGRGTGLGLSTVYGIVRQTGGAITVVSERGKGASFKVYLPAVAGESQ
jgi:PAS domain S-box-containing protein